MALKPLTKVEVGIEETCDACERKVTSTMKRGRLSPLHPCRFEVACSCWRGVPCDGSGRVKR